MSVADELFQYRADVIAAHRVAHHRARSFRSAKEWSRVSEADWRAQPFLEGETQLTELLASSRAILLGEAGSGKSTECSGSVEVAIGLGWVPVVAKLRDYQGSLIDCLSVPLPESVRAHGGVLLWILDGFDEAEESHLAALKLDLTTLQSEEETRILLTSRQAFFETQKPEFDGTWSVFHLLELTDHDVRALVQAESVSVSGFEAAAAEVGLLDETTNPFALWAMIRTFQQSGHLGTDRSSSVGRLIDIMLKTRPTSDPKRQRRALRMLALAMETAARNVLSDSECRAVLRRALGISDDAAETLLGELSQSLLVRLMRGWAFQMRSFGEYLAAEDLSEIRERDRILQLIFTDGTRVPSWSWRNAVSYLIELHPGIRTHFVRRFPDWTLASSPRAFDDRQKDDIVQGVLDHLAGQGEYLSYHPLVRAQSLSRLVTQSMLAALQQRLHTSTGADATNVLLLLGACGDRSVANDALRISLDVTQSAHTRASAFSALGSVGSAEMIPILLRAPDGDEGTLASRLEAASALVDAGHLPDLLRALARTDMFVTGAFNRFRQFSSADDVDVFLGALRALETNEINGNNCKYLDSVWQLAVRSWRSDWAAQLASLLLRVGGRDSRHELADGLLRTLSAAPAIEAAVGEALVSLIRGGADVSQIDFRLYRLVHLETVRALVASGTGADLISRLRAFGRRDVCIFLTPADDRPREISAWELRQQEAEASHRTHQDTVRDLTSSGDATVRALAQLPPERWPDLPAQKVQALSVDVVEKLKACDVRNRIVWNSETQWSQPGVLTHLVRVIERYGLTLPDDSDFVQTIRGWEHKAVANYHKQRGLSNAALAEIVRLAGDSTQPTGALDGIFRFIRQAGLSGGEIAAAAEAIVRSDRKLELRRLALDVFLAGSPPAGQLTALANRLPDVLTRTIETALLERQDKPTILRRLAALTEDPAVLTTAEATPAGDESALDWLARVRLPEVLPELKNLRRQALLMRLGGTAGIFTSTIARVDPSGVAGIIREQIADTPGDWRSSELNRAIEYERDDAVRLAQAAPFERVLQRLRRATTINLFKVWAEGPNDVPPLVALVRQLPGDVSADIEVQSVNGWGSILASSWTASGLATGCHDLHLVLDGDRARDYSVHGYPLRPEISRVIQKLDENDIPFTILDRYAIENYFSQAAYESLLGPGLTFPLLPDRSVTSQLPLYSKTMNGQLAQQTPLADLVGTDLGALLEDIRRRASG